MSIKILSVAKAVPETTITNDQLSEFLDTNDEWISTRTGIKTRHICTTETLLDLCVEAVEDAISKANIDKSEIDAVICSTLVGDYLTPSLSCGICEKLDIICPAFDINAACSGFIYALDIASAYIDTGRASNILIVCAEKMSKIVDWEDRSTCVLFGDGAAACLVTKGTALKNIQLTTKGNSSILNLPVDNGNCPFREKEAAGFLYMQGQEVFKFAVSMIVSQSERILSDLNMTPEDIDYYVLHQANKRIIDFARMKLKQEPEKFPMNVDKYGNTSSASIPILLEEMISDGRIKPGTRLLLSAFGAGLTTGICVIEWE